MMLISPLCLFLPSFIKGAGSGGWMDACMREFYITFIFVRPDRPAGTTVMRRVALVARMKLPSNMAAPGTEHKVQRLGAQDANH